MNNFWKELRNLSEERILLYFLFTIIFAFVLIIPFKIKGFVKDEYVQVMPVYLKEDKTVTEVSLLTSRNDIKEFGYVTIMDVQQSLLDYGSIMTNLESLKTDDVILYSDSLYNVSLTLEYRQAYLKLKKIILKCSINHIKKREKDVK